MKGFMIRKFKANLKGLKLRKVPRSEKIQRHKNTKILQTEITNFKIRKS